GDSSDDRPECVQDASNGFTLDALDGSRTNPGRINGEGTSEHKLLIEGELGTTSDVSDVSDDKMQLLSEALSVGTAYRVVRDASELSMVAQAIEDSSRVALDLETTGLDPRHDRIRLLQLGTEHGLYIIDCFAVDPRPLLDSLAEVVLIGHNL